MYGHPCVVLRGSALVGAAHNQEDTAGTVVGQGDAFRRAMAGAPSHDDCVISLALAYDQVPWSQMPFISFA